MPPINTFTKTALTFAVSQALIASSNAATIEVDSNLDAIDPTAIASCTLRKAIDSLNSGVMVAGCIATGTDLGDQDTITFAANLANTTITLAGQSLKVNNNSKQSNISLQGRGITIDANQQSRIFKLENNNALTLDHLTLSNGSFPSVGGAIFVDDSSLTITNSTLTRNNSRAGGAIDARDSTLNISDCVISHNTAKSESSAGGGVNVIRSDSNFNRVSFDSNVATRDVRDPFDPLGGGLFVSQGEVKVTNSTFTKNQAIDEAGRGMGGAIYARFSGTKVTVTNSTLSQNTAGERGGGLLGNSSAEFAVSNSTISGNTAGRDGGGIYLEGILSLVNSTITSNSAATRGGGVFLRQEDGEITNSLVAGNSASSLGAEIALSNAVLTNSGVNVFGFSGSNSFSAFTPASTDIVVDIAAPAALGRLISPLANNGGPTLTHALPAGSPAINEADSALCTNAPINQLDQRGEPRDASCDIGAFEFIEPESNFFGVPIKNGRIVIFEL